ncbi:MAG: diacylglycerol kinase family protein [Chthoniobacterales bacterium]
MSRPFQFTGRLRSFKYALQGIAYMLKSQHNAWLHAAATLVVVGGGLYFQISIPEWCWTVLAITSVWTAEAMNTAFEFLCDATTKDFHPLVGRAKDVAAGAVLLTALGASLIGLIIFLPKILGLFTIE